LSLGQAEQKTKKQEKKRFSLELTGEQYKFLDKHSRHKSDILRKALDKVKEETESNGGNIREVLPDVSSD